MDEDNSNLQEGISFGQFLTQYYHQFAIMGIFATVSVFFSSSLQQTNASPPPGTRAGLIASLLLLASVTVWITYQALRELTFLGEMPLSTELGLAILTLSGFTLLYSVVIRVSQFEITLVFVNMAAVVGLLIIFIGRFPKKTYNNVVENVQITPIAFIVSFIYLMVLRYTTFIESSTNSQLPEPLNLIFIATFAFVFFCVSLPLAEALLGFKIVQATKFNSIKERLFRPYLFSESIFIACIGILVLSIAASQKAGSITQGQLEFYGHYWRALLFYHWFVLTLIIVPYRFFDLNLPLRNKYLHVQGISVGILVLCLIESVMIYFGMMTSVTIPV